MLTLILSQAPTLSVPTGLGWVINGGAILVLVGVVTAVLTGKLIPRNTHDTQVNHIKGVADLWKTAAETKDATLGVLAPAVNELVESSKAVEAALTGLRKVVDEIAQNKKTGGGIQ